MAQDGDRQSVVRALLLMMQGKHAPTREHMEKVSRYSGLLGRELGMSAAGVARVELAGLLHDVGKVAIPDHILTKPGPLEMAEARYMMRHAEIGAALVLAVGCLDDVSASIRYHHEWHDGRGYPDGLAGEEIPLEARMIAVADAFDTMTTPRPYRRPVSILDALEEIERCAGTQFDPVPAEAFVSGVRRAWDTREAWVRDLAAAGSQMHPVRFTPLAQRMRGQQKKSAVPGA